MAKEQDEGVSGKKLTKRRDIRGRGILANQLNRFLAEDKPGWSDTKDGGGGGIWSETEDD